MADVRDTDILTDGSPNVLAGLVKDSVTGKKKIVPLAVKELSAGVWALDVGATIDAGDIEIGAVELKNGASDDRAVVEDKGGGMALDVNVVYGGGSGASAVKISDTSGTPNASVETRGSKGALAVEILDASGAQITSFGSGTVKLSDSSGTPNVTVATKGSVGAMAVQIVDGSGAQVTSFGGATTIADGADVTLGAKADAKSTATDTTPVTAMQVLKEISYMAQNPATETVVGDVASGAADGTSKPVKVGGRFNSAAPTLTDGFRADLQLDVNGNLKEMAPSMSATGNLVLLPAPVLSLAVGIQGQTTVGFALSGTWTGTIIAEMSVDGTTWTQVSVFNYATKIQSTADITANGTYAMLGLHGAIAARVRATALTVAPVTVVVTGSRSNGVIAQYSNPDGTVLPGRIVAMGGNNGGNIKAFVSDANGNQPIVGSVAHAAADSGNPVKVGAKYNASAITDLTDGNRSDLQADIKGNLKVTGSIADATADTAGNPIKMGGIYRTSPTTYTNGQRTTIQTDVNGNAIVAGNIAHAATDSGSPVKVGGKYNLAGVTLVDGQRGDIQLSAIGQVYVNQGAIAGEDFADTALGSMQVNSNKQTMTVYNVTMTLANTEYSQALPATCKGFTIRCRGAFDVKFTMAVGASGTTYFTIPASSSFNEESTKLSSKTLYFQCATAAQVLEIIAWS